MTDRHDDTTGLDDPAVDELLGAYALYALEPGEAATVEEALARRPELAAEADRLTRAAAWLGATEGVAPPPGLRGGLLGRALARRGDSGPVAAYLASTERLADTFAALAPDDYATPTPNGLDAHDLVVHLAAQESMLAQAIGDPVVGDIRDIEVESRTQAFVERYRDVSVTEVAAIWRRSVDAVDAWAADPTTGDAALPWLGLDLPRDSFLVVRAFENWIHRDDLLRAQGRGVEPPPAAEIHEMAELSVGTLPLALSIAERAHPGKVARVVLTGPGGGEWRVPMGGADDPARPPDVTIAADVVDWCLVAGERLAAADLECDVEGDRRLADDLLAAAPAFATL
jgi:uncharacterized protein (TIGR03083 family)